ncbi:MAG: response regulator [Desulfosarcinaceae bacterium]
MSANAHIAEPLLRLPLLLPSGRDADLVRQVLEKLPLADIVLCPTREAFLTGLDEECGLFVVGDKALSPPTVRRLMVALDHQPEWSDLPGIVLTSSEALPSHIEALAAWRGISIVYRPVRVSVLRNLMLAAVETRRRQYQVRDLLAELQTTNQRLRSRSELLRTLSLELTRAEARERRRIAQMLHDDLQQMLVSARLHSELLSDDLPRESVPKAQQVYDILSNAIETTRLLSHELNPISVANGSFSEGLQRLATRAAKDYDVEVHLTCSPRHEGLSEETKLFIYHSLQELLLNCAKHANANQVQIDVSGDGPLVLVSLTDDGVGFDIGRLNIKGGDEGGFGLFSIQERTKALGGSLKIDSARGKGCRMVLSLPVEQPDVADTAAAGESRGASTETTATIAVMIAEDHAVMRQSLADLLKRHTGIEVVAQAADGEQAVALALQYRPQVVLMDVSMPLLDGIAATRRIVAESSTQVAVIALSASDDAEVRDQILAAGAREFLSKNVQADELITAVRRYATPRPDTATGSLGTDG